MRAIIILCAIFVIALAATILVPGARATKTQWLAELSEGPCKSRDETISFITRRFGETIRGGGASRDGQVELWHSPGGRTFTILLRRPDDTYCVLRFGENWLRR